MHHGHNGVRIPAIPGPIPVRIRVGGVAVMIDNFAIPAATIRGLFDFDYRSDRLILRPRVPGTITQYTQKQPVRFGEKKLFISCNNGGPDVKSVKVNGKEINVTTPKEIALIYDALPAEAKVEITTEGGWPKEKSSTEYPIVPALIPGKGLKDQTPSVLPDSLQKPFKVLTVMNKLFLKEPAAEYERAFVAAAIKSFDDYRVRCAMDPGPGYYRAIDAVRKESINRFYALAAQTMYKGFAKRMESYSTNGNTQQKHLATLFSQALK